MVYYDDSGSRIYRRVKRRPPTTDAAGDVQHLRQDEAEHPESTPAEEKPATGTPQQED